jgi:hypothetical protein
VINKEELDRAIAEHESGANTYANCERLAWLYIIRDHMKEGHQDKPAEHREHTEEPYNQNAPSDHIKNDGNSDFLKAINGKDTKKVLSVMDELMEALQLIQPRMYDAVLIKIKDL